MILIAGLAAALAQAGALTVPATGDIWLSGQPDGSSVTGYFGSDFAPANSPVEISVVAGQVLTFSASGNTSVDGRCFAGPDGGCYPDESGFSPTPLPNDIGNYKGPADALIGVFLDSSVPNGADGPGPDSADFTGANDFTSLSPLLNQIFFIGDGLTGTGTGTVQEFFVPAGATRLFLTVGDSLGAASNNLGSLEVTVTPATPTPEPSTAALASLACLALAALAARRRRASSY